MSNVLYVVRLSIFSVRHDGKTDITYHIKSNEHKIVQMAELIYSKVNSYFYALKANNKTLKLAVKK